MKFAVTGASGFVASNLLNVLDEMRIEYIGLSRAAPSTSLASERIIFVDYADPILLESALNGVDVVVHLAGLAHKKLPIHSSRLLLYRANVDCLKRICEASLNQGVRKIIYISSIGVLGASTSGLPFDDFSSVNPHNHYAESKYEAELMLSNYASSDSLDYLILRPPLVYGERCPGNLAKLINFIKASPIVPFGDLCNRRSFMFVDNLINAIIAASFSSVALNCSYVLSDCVDISLRTVVLSLLDGLGKSNSRLVSCDPKLLAACFMLLGKKHIFDQLSTELLVDASRFRLDTNWSPCVHPVDALRLTAASFA